jgi:Immunoglobulin-like domain of bacterial spore germination/Sporulation and spore germination
MRSLPVLALLLVLAAGCGSGDSESAGSSTTTAATTAPATTETQPPEEMTLSVYFLRDGRIAAESRSIPKTQGVAFAALRALIDGPTPEERADGITSEVLADTRIELLTVENGTAIVELSDCGGLAQVVYTLTQFPTVDRVETGCRAGKLTRASFEEETPAIFVESPTPGAEVTSPLRVVGTANTFEATFMYELKDASGKVVAKDFVTATSGSGTRGTFDVTIPFVVSEPGGTLTVYESSAEDGSRIHEVEIPLELQP